MSHRHNKTSGRTAPPAHARTSQQIRDGTKKAGADLESMCASFWSQAGTGGYSNTSIAHELEVKFGTRNKWFERLGKNDYDNVISKLRSIGFTTELDTGAYMLRIQPEFLDSKRGTYIRSSVRTEIRGIPAIQEYCVHNDLAKLLDSPTYAGAVSMHKKDDAKHPVTGERIMSVNFDDFQFRVSYSLEEEYGLASRFGIAKSTVDNWLKSKKSFRYINRVTFTHPDYPVKVDLSIVKSGGMKDMVYTTSDAGVFQADEEYEFEVEVDPKAIGVGTQTADVAALISKLRTCIKFVLMGLQETAYPISVRDKAGRVKV